MTVYLGKNPVGVGRIVEKKVAKTKFGASVDNFLGDVDADGIYVEPSEPFEVNLAGVKSVPANCFRYKFQYSNGIVALRANDVINVGLKAFYGCLNFAKNINVVQFDSLEEISADSVFEAFFEGTSFPKNISFAKLKRIAANYVFRYFASVYSGVINFDEMFPVLEEISGQSVFANFRSISANTVYTYSKIKKITGGSATHQATFGSFYIQNTIWNFPSATEFTGYIWNVGSSYAGEIHFAAANQAAIEACDGYANKWGFQGASLFFDL